MRLRVPTLSALACFGLTGCARASGHRDKPAPSTPPRDFGEVTSQAFERHPNLRKAPEGWVQDSMFGCALSRRSDRSTPKADRMINGAKACDLMAEGNRKEIDPYCRLSEFKNYLP